MPPPTQPIIGSLSPNSGPIGSLVNIEGTNFGTSGEVTFNGVFATPISWASNSILVHVPATATTGLVVVIVGSQRSVGVTFTVTTLPAPTISGLSPSSGPVGTPVTITGTNFGTAQGSSTVTFNGVAATVTSWSATSIVAAVPATATTGPVIVTVSSVASNSSTFTVTTPSNGGMSTPLNLLLIPANGFNGPLMWTLDPTNFNDAMMPSSYFWKVEDVIAGRIPTINRVIISYRDLGVVTATVTLSGIIPNTTTPTSVSVTVTLGSLAATGKIITVVDDTSLSLSAQNIQLSISRAAGAGPLSITKVRMEGKVETTTY